MGVIAFTPRRLDDALQYLHQYGDETNIIAGGTDILVKYHQRLVELQRLVNIWELQELKSIRIVNEQIEIGSLLTHTQIEESTIVLQNVPFLAEAAASVGSPQIRHRGTIGGNVANASPAGDLITPLLVLAAKVKLVSLDRGEREVPLEEFFVGPGRHIAKKDELITGFVFPVPEETFVGTFHKLGSRKALAISTVNTAVLLRLEDTLIKDCRIALGSVAPTPKRAKLLEDILLGQSLTELRLKDLIKQLEKDISPITDIRGSQRYRLDTAKELVLRALERTLKEGGGDDAK